jgi:hypothetical protein
MLEQHEDDLDPPMFRRYVQWGSAFVVICTYIRTMPEQHAHDLDAPMSRRAARCNGVLP